MPPRLPAALRSSWTWAAPLLGWLLLAGAGIGGWYGLALGAGLLGSVLAAVHHAELIAHKVGEPFGTLVLALAVTVIEVALIVSLMVTSPDGGPTLARDAVFAAVMLILNGIVGLCLLLGAARHREQEFEQRGVSAALATLAALAVLTLVLPNHTQTVPGPVYTPAQLAFVALVSLALYGVFVFVQTVRHRDYFLPVGPAARDDEVHAPPPSARAAWTSVALLLVSLGAVVLLAKSLAPTAERAVDEAGLPRAVVGVAVSGLVLLPESWAALRAARANRLQTSLNLALGSALATIALTVPAVALLSIGLGWELVLGIDSKGTVLLALSLLVATLALGTGKTTVLQGAVHLVLFAVFVFLTFVP